MKTRKRGRAASPHAQPRPRPEDTATRTRNVLAVAVLAAVTLLAYSNSFGGGLVFDSRGLILEDARIRAATGQNLDLILRHTYWWPYGESGLYRPVATLSYLFNYAVLGNAERPAGYHGVNFLLHFGNVLLAFALARRLVGAFGPALFVAALWAVHPVLTESVTNIVGRPDLLAGMAILGGVLIYVKSAEAQGWRRWAWLVALTVVTMAGVFSKESAIVLPGVVTLFELTWWRERRRGRALLLGCLAILPAVLIMLYQRAVVLARVPPAFLPFWDNPLTGADFWAAKLTALRIIAKYLGLLVWPARLSCDYSYAQIPFAHGALQDWLGWLVVAAVVAGAALAFRFNRTVFFAAGLAFLTWLPTSNLLFPIGTIMAERFLYLPCLAFTVCLVLAVYAPARRLGQARLAAVALGLIVVAFAARTWVRNRDWRDDVSLMTAAVETSPRSYKTHSALAAALFDRDPSHADMGRVIEEAEEALTILEPLPESRKPPLAYHRAGQYYLAQGDLARERGLEGGATAAPDGTRAYRRALELLERCRTIATASHQELAANARARGRPIPELDTSRLADVERKIVAARLGLGDPRGAAEAARRALDAEPQSVSAYRQLATALVAAGRMDEAAVALAQGVMITSDMSLREDLLRLYRDGLDTEGCAVVARGPYETAVNPTCGIVRKHSCAAVAASMRLYVRTGRRNLAEQLKASALRDIGCAVGPLDAILP
jgi:tetratricopeptide (TPR) repeat protein